MLKVKRPRFQSETVQNTVGWAGGDDLIKRGIINSETVEKKSEYIDILTLIY